MEILFGQYFDQGYYLDYSWEENQTSFDRQIVGPLGLLDLLERDLGLSGNFPSLLERRVKYQDILGKYLKNNPGNLFDASFAVDPQGVTSELLRCRDQLVFAGWNSKMMGISSRIDLLASVEESGKILKGTEDRCIAVFQAIVQNKNVTFGFNKISLNESDRTLHPFFGTLFGILRERGIEVHETINEYSINQRTNLGKVKNKILGNSPLCELDQDDKYSLQVLRFKSDTDAAEFLASQKQSPENTVILNRDNRLYDEMLNSFGLPVSGSAQIDANPSLVQLFRLITVLLYKPVNIYNLLSYLQVDVNPVPASLRYRLMKVLKERGGMNNSDWAETIQEYEFNNDATRDRVVNFLTVRDFVEDGIDRTETIRLYQALESWARERMILGGYYPAINSQFAYLIELCKGLKGILQDENRMILPKQELSSLISGIYEKESFINYVPQSGACRVLAYPDQIIDHPETIIWLDFYNEPMKPAFYSFLNRSEIENLENCGVAIWTSSDQVLAKMEMFQRGLLLPEKRCVLIVVEKACGEVVTDHPLNSWLKTSLPDFEKLCSHVNPADTTVNESLGWNLPEILLQDSVSLPEKKSVHEIRRGDLFPRRLTESSSSMELLIQDPFDWIFRYPLKIQSGYSYQLDDLFTTMGTVAHRFIEVLFTKTNYQVEAAYLLLEDFENMVQSIAEGHGMILLLDENRIDYEVFKFRLKESVSQLIGLLIENGLEVKGLETELTVNLPVLNEQEVNGKIDLILSKNNGHLMIFDLKWSWRPGRFYTIIKENKHIQLSLYKELIEAGHQARVDSVSYFSLADGRIFTTGELNGSQVVCISGTASSWQILSKVKNSLRFRWDQLNGGMIEEAGGNSMENLDYYQNQEQSELMPLESEYGKNGLKKINQYSQYKTFKGEII